MTTTSALPTAAPRSKRRRRWLPIAAIAVVAMLAVLAYLVWVSDLLTVDRVEVQGAALAAPASIEAAAAVAIGQRMSNVDEGDVADRVARLDPVASVTVQRRWPSTVRIQVTERVPAAVLPLGKGFVLYDDAGVDFAEVASAPKGLPVLRLGRDGASASAVADLLAVNAALPDQVRSQVATLAPKSSDDLRLTLKDGTEVRWGAAGGAAAKVESLILLQQAEPKADYYDVSAPDAPAAG